MNAQSREFHERQNDRKSARKSLFLSRYRRVLRLLHGATRSLLPRCAAGEDLLTRHRTAINHGNWLAYYSEGEEAGFTRDCITGQGVECGGSCLVSRFITVELTLVPMCASLSLSRVICSLVFNSSFCAFARRIR